MRGPEKPGLDQAAGLAAELARFLDQAETEELPLDALAGLAPEEHAQHWQRTLAFLAVLTETWPSILEAEGALDPARRRSLLIRAQAERWRTHPPEHPVIAAGSTGSIPATAELLDTIARLPRGRVLLPGLDREADDATWAAIEDDPCHPQYGLARLLRRFGVRREEVRSWPVEAPAGGSASAPASRASLVAEALRPASATHTWRSAPLDPATIEEAVSKVRRIDCPGPEAEALVVALLLREALETPGKTAALITPDRGLARRAAAELARWGVAVDDSAGTPLAATPPGLYLRLLAEAAADRLAPVPLLALLKHPLAAGGLTPSEFRARARQLELAALRGPRPAKGWDGLSAALAASKSPELAAWVADLAARLSPFVERVAEGSPVAELVDAHLAAAERLAESREAGGAERLWAGEAGEALADFAAGLREAVAGMTERSGRDYPALLDALLAGRVVRPRWGRHPRLFIWGPLEARLQRADLVVLGGLNEGTWPADAFPDPWLSRPMRATFGLPPAERRVGLSAHDFAQAMMAPEVALTRAERVEGTPTVPSRWLLRLEAMLAAAGRPQALAPDRRWLSWQRDLDRQVRWSPVSPPDPRPPLAARPRRLSVTEIGTWMRDPYAIYARRILKLEPLDPIDADATAAERGEFVHAALDRFVKEHPGELPEDALARLIAIGRSLFAEREGGRPGMRAYWWPRFLRMADWFIAVEREQRRHFAPLATEIRGQMEVPGKVKPFLLVAKADRIDRGDDGRLTIIDYKTGAIPTQKEIAAGLQPQLPLEAAMALAGRFAGVDAAPVGELSFWRLSGGREPGSIKSVKGYPEQHARAALAGLVGLVAAFDEEATPYAAQPRPGRVGRFGDYDHLARVKEWGEGGGDEE
jgi:ATP-dependent helicase/nuclease subunit B